MAKKVKVECEFRNHEVAEVLRNFDSIEDLVRNVPGYYPMTTSKAYRLELAGLVLFVKYYQAQQDGFRLSRVIRSKPSRERNNLLLFRRLGVATLQPVAVGVKRFCGVFQTGFLVTLEERGAIELARLAKNSPGRLSDRGFRTELSTKLADAVRALHDHNFFHNDLNWRNVLIRETPELEVFIFDSPMGRRWYPPLREHRLIKDLGALDRLARVYLSRTQRLRFYHDYTGRKSLTSADKQRLAQVAVRSDIPLGQADSNKSSFVIKE